MDAVDCLERPAHVRAGFDSCRAVPRGAERRREPSGPSTAPNRASAGPRCLSRTSPFLMRTSLSLIEARRVALAAQGFAKLRPPRATVRHLSNTIRRLGLLQIDCVNVVCAAHYMV